MVQLSTDHEAVFSFVVQLHALHEILVGSHILVFLAVTEDGQELVQFELLVSCITTSKNENEWVESIESIG